MHEQAKQQPTLVDGSGFPWRVPVLCAALAVACVPLYGYFVHVNRDSQLTALVIFACWAIGFISIPTAIAYMLMGPKVSRPARLACWLLIAAIPIVLVIGIGGLQHTLYELVAG